MIFPRKLVSALKYICLLTIFSIFWIQIKFQSDEFPSSLTSSSAIHTHQQLDSETEFAKSSSSILPFNSINQLADFIHFNNELQIINNEDKFGQIGPQHLYYSPKDSSSDANVTPNTFNSSDLNSSQSLQHQFPEPFIVIVVQVHNRAKYLMNLINSLRMTRGIENVLLVFSHDLYHERFDLVINSIDFCRVSLI